MKHKDKQRFYDWLFRAVGGVLLIFAYSTYQSGSGELLFKELRLTLAQDMRDVKSLRTEVDYQFAVEGHEADFLILRNSVDPQMEEKLSALQKGQTVDVRIALPDETELQNPVAEISVYALSQGLEQYLIVVEDDGDRGLSRAQIVALMLFAGLFLIINGFYRLPKQVNSILVVLFMLSIVFWDDLLALF
ncbi:MAG: hypothetical protein AAF206_18265 [Bacteroidota bacterium]